MYLSRFGVKNYKCLGDIDVPLTPIHVLIGENDAGKTSLLEAMAAFHVNSEEALRKAVPGTWKGRDLIRHGSDAACFLVGAYWSSTEPIHSGGEVTELGYEVEVTHSAAKNMLEFRDRFLEVNGVRHGIPLTSRMSDAQADADAYKQRARMLKECLEAARGLRQPAHKYRFDPGIMAVPATIDTQRKLRLDPDGFGLSTLLSDISDYDPERQIRLRQQFCEFFPQFKSVRIESARALQRQYEHDGIHSTAAGEGKGIYFETTDGATIRGQQASDGAILFLGFLALAHLPDPPNLLLIEEPENGVYPKRLGQVISMLKELVKDRDESRFPQIIMTTHSPYVLSHFEPEEVTFLSRPPDDPDGPVRARALRDAPNIRERMGSEFYLGELWYNLSEEELFGEP